MKRISGYIRSIPGGDPVLNIPVTIRDQSTGVAIPVGGLYGGSTNPINTDNVTGYFEWTTELDPGPVRIEAVPGVGVKKVRSTLEQTAAMGVWISDVPEYFKVFSNGVITGQGNAFSTTSSALILTLRDGEAIVGGRFWKTSTNRSFTIPSNAVMAERWDAVILRQHISGATIGRQEILVIPGIATGVLPNINTDVTKLDLLLWTVKVANGASSLVLVDSRVYTKYTNLANSVTAAMLSTSAVNSTADVAKVYKAPTSGSTPVIDTLSTRELSDVADIGATVGQVPVWNNLTSQYEPQSITLAKPVVENIDVVTVASTSVFDFSNAFAVFETPTGEANIAIANGGITAAMLATDSVGAAQIQADAVGSAEIVAGAVGSAELGTGAVIAGKYGSLSIATGDLAANIVTPAKMQRTGTATHVLTSNGGAVDPSYQAIVVPDGSVTNVKMAVDSVNASNIVDGSITGGEIAANTIGLANLTRGSVAGRVLTANGSGTNVSYQDIAVSHPTSARASNARDEVAAGMASVTSTTGQVITGLWSDITLAAGIVYDVFIFGGASVQAPGADYIAAVIDSLSALGSPVVSLFNGEGTSTGSKYHSGSVAFGFTGSGGTIRCGLWFKVGSGTGFVGSGSITVVGLPRSSS